MKKTSRVLSVILTLILASSPLSASAGEPDFKDFYMPIIQDVAIKPIVNVETDASGKKQYPVTINVSLKVKVHRNSLAGFGFRLFGPVSTIENLCQSLSNQAPNWDGIWISIGNTQYSGGEGDLKVLAGLKSRTPSDDWFIEFYSLDIPVRSNKNFFPCEGTNTVNSIIVRDIAGRYKQFVSRGDGTPAPIKSNQPDTILTPFRFDSPYRAILPEFACTKVVGGEWNSSPLRCLDTFASSSFTITFSGSDKVAAELKAKQEAEAKSAAELKAKQEAEAVAAAELKAKQEAEAKAAADKAAAEAEAKARIAATKKTTITCIKGKLTKKVTAVKPTCPPGYKKK